MEIFLDFSDELKKKLGKRYWIMDHLRFILMLLIFVISSSMVGCASNQPAVDYSAYQQPVQPPPEATPDVGADEVLLSAINGETGRTYSRTVGSYYSSATALKAYPKKGRLCKDVYGKIFFEKKVIEDRKITVCQYNDRDWFVEDNRNRGGYVAPQQQPVQSYPVYPCGTPYGCQYGGMWGYPYGRVMPYPYYGYYGYGGLGFFPGIGVNLVIPIGGHHHR